MAVRRPLDLAAAPGIPRARVFHGWLVVAAAFALTFVGFGSAYTFGAFVDSFERAFGASRGAVSIVFAVAGFLTFGVGSVSGPLADRWGARRVTTTGTILIGVGFGAMGAAHTLTQLGLGYALAAGLGTGSIFVPSLGVVQRWFVRRRGLASGIAVSGVGVGTLVMPPLAEHLIAALGWRASLVVLGALAAAVGAVVCRLVEDDPRDRGLEPDGDVRHAVRDRPSAPYGVALREAVRTRPFAGLYAACLLASFGLLVPFVHLVPYARDHGLARSSAVLLLSVLGVGSTAGRFLIGGLADRTGRRPALLAMYLGLALALAFWSIATGPWSLSAFALAYGLFYGGLVALLPAFITDHFGTQHISSIMGVLYTSVAFGTLLGPSATGLAFDITHSYTVPILGAAVANLVAAGIVAVTSAR